MNQNQADPTVEEVTKEEIFPRQPQPDQSFENKG